MRLCCQFFTILGILSCAVAAQAGDIVGTVNLGRDNSNAAVYIERIPGKTFPAPAQNPKIDQKQMVFIPHVLPILLGTTVEFHNSDTVLHNVFTPSPAGDTSHGFAAPHRRAATFCCRRCSPVRTWCRTPRARRRRCRARSRPARRRGPSAPGSRAPCRTR